MNIGLGYFLGGPGSDMGSAAAFGHGGYGGAMGFADRDNKLAVGFTRNLYIKGEGRPPYFRILREAMGLI